MTVFLISFTGKFVFKSCWTCTTLSTFYNNVSIYIYGEFCHSVIIVEELQLSHQLREE